MSQSIIISVIKELSQEDLKKVQIIENCQGLGIPVPTCLKGFKREAQAPLADFDGGVLHIDSPACLQWQHPEHDDIYGVEIKLQDLPENVKRIRIVIE